MRSSASCPPDCAGAHRAVRLREYRRCSAALPHHDVLPEFRTPSVTSLAQLPPQSFAGQGGATARSSFGVTLGLGALTTQLRMLVPQIRLFG